MAVNRTWTDPTGIDLTTGQKFTQTKAQQILSNLNALGGIEGHIGVKAYHSIAQSVAHNSETALALDSEHWDTDGMHDTAVNNSRLTRPYTDLPSLVVPNRYLIIGRAAFAANATGYRMLRIKLDGTDYVASTRVDASATAITEIEVSTVIEMVANQYVQLIAYQNSTVPLDLSAVQFMAVRI